MTKTIIVCGQKLAVEVISKREDVDNFLLDQMIDDPKEKAFYRHLLTKNQKEQIAIVQKPEIVEWWKNWTLNWKPEKL